MNATSGHHARRPARRSTRVGGAAIFVASTVACLACGSAGGLPGEEPPSSLIGFVGGIEPGVGFVGGGRGRHDAGPYPPDAPGGGEEGGNVVHDSGASGGGHDAASDASDGGSSIGVTINLPSGFFVSLDWTIVGPSGSYSGAVPLGAAQSIEFVVGGIQAGDGYVITLTGKDPSGDFCIGVSEPFSVSPGATAAAGVTIECFTGDGGPRPAPVMSGSVAVDAGVLAQ